MAREALTGRWSLGGCQSGMRRLVKMAQGRDFPGGPVVRALRFHCRGLGSNPGRGTKILQAERHSQKKKKKKRHQEDSREEGWGM